jgi:hypothetical protein
MKKRNYSISQVNSSFLLYIPLLSFISFFYISVGFTHKRRNEFGKIKENKTTNESRE